MVKTYEVHNNGGRPYSVLIDNKNVIIYDNEDGKELYDLRNVLKIFIGINPEGDTDIGNTILIEKKDKQYIFIGHIVKQFKTFDNIIKFHSYVGNSDVPYPYAVGDRFLYSFITECGYIGREEYQGAFDDYNKVIDFLLKFEKSLTKCGNKIKRSTLQHYYKIKHILSKPIEDIKLAEAKILVDYFSVTKSGSKKQLLERLEKVRRIKFN
jgi:hypothetical protein